MFTALRNFSGIFNRKPDWAAWSAVVLLAWTGAARADSVTLLPAADTYISDINPIENSGALSELKCGVNRLGNISRVLYAFDIAGAIPSNAVISSVALTVQVVTRIPSGAPVNSSFDLHRVLQQWNEPEATWNNRLAPDLAWTAPGAARGSDFASAVSAAVAVTGLGRYTFNSTAALVSDVQGWLTNAAANFGWIMMTRLESTPQTARLFGSRENIDAAPQLAVEYSVPAAATPPAIVSQPQSEDAFAGENATFTVSANGTEPLAYQWSKNQTVVTGATNAALMLTNVTLADAGDYSVSVGNSAGTTNSATAHLSILGQGPVIDQVTAQSGTISITFTVAPTYVLALQFADALSAPTWATLTNVSAKFQSLQVTVPDSVSIGSPRFYRLVVAGRVR